MIVDCVLHSSHNTCTQVAQPTQASLKGQSLEFVAQVKEGEVTAAVADRVITALNARNAHARAGAVPNATAGKWLSSEIVGPGWFDLAMKHIYLAGVCREPLDAANTAVFPKLTVKAAQRCVPLQSNDICRQPVSSL